MIVFTCISLSTIILQNGWNLWLWSRLITAACRKTQCTRETLRIWIAFGIEAGFGAIHLSVWVCVCFFFLTTRNPDVQSICVGLVFDHVASPRKIFSEPWLSVLPSCRRQPCPEALGCLEMRKIYFFKLNWLEFGGHSSKVKVTVTSQNCSGHNSSNLTLLMTQFLTNVW